MQFGYSNVKRFAKHIRQRERSREYFGKRGTKRLGEFVGRFGSA